MTGERKLLQTPCFLLLTILLLIGARLGGKEVEVEPVIIPIFDFVSFVMKGITDLQYVTKNTFENMIKNIKLAKRDNDT